MRQPRICTEQLEDPCSCVLMSMPWGCQALSFDWRMCSGPFSGLQYVYVYAGLLNMLSTSQHSAD